MSYKWHFVDPVNAEEYDFEVNPKEGGTPTFEKTMAYINTSAPNGRALAFEGRQKVQESEFSGVILSESQYNAMLHWFNKRNQFYVTDDLNRTFSIYITKFSAKRIRAHSHPWKHEYNCSYVIIDWD